MRVLLTVWKIYNDVVPTFTNLNRHHLRCEIVCPLCGATDDSTSHTFLLCSFARAVWFGLPITYKYHPRNCTFRTWLTSWIIRWRRNKERFSEAGLDALWNCRNGAVWRNTKPDPISVIRIIQSSVSFYVNVFDCLYLLLLMMIKLLSF